jgi:hypothetical protein
VSPRIDDGEVDRLGVGATRQVLDGHIDFATISESVGLGSLVCANGEAQLGEAIAAGDG